jgi:RimJ/RimL family protein N-acetyltransferase
MSDLRSDDSVKQFLNLQTPLCTIDQYALSITAPRDRCHFAIIGRESGAFIGVAGFLSRDPFLAPEIYVWLARASRGHCLGPEAANALIDAAFSARYCNAVIGIPHSENIPSIKALPKMKMNQCASVVDICETESGYEVGREHTFPIFYRERPQH